ncbi:MAG: 2-dehydropantoate 2-reductase [Clostridia bacterium]|nr:2-dehydropantoate 2-reductase [Clostridia bacterium]
MKIYIDFDDVICETAQFFSELVKKRFGVDVPYREMRFFNMQKAFDLTDAQYDELMREGHLAESLLSYRETEGASETINKWADEGHEIYIITGRPYESYAASEEWLAKHDLGRIPLFCVDKYGRSNDRCRGEHNITLEQLYAMDFDFAVEDSPEALRHLLHFAKCRTAVFSRPWNSRTELPNDSFVRCDGWKATDEFLKQQ